MNKEGRILGIVLTLAAVVMFVFGLASPGVVDGFRIYWMATFAAFIPGVMLLVNMQPQATFFARIVVGSVFIVSGLIKANDTIGFGIKLEEYFDENALGSFWAAFHDYATPIAFLISGIEVLLGLAVIYGIRIRLASILLLLMTLFFGWLTYYTARCNEAQLAAMVAGEAFDGVCVTDCGCFGDALRGSVGRALTPWESFYKDLGLLFLTLIILFRSGKIKLNTLMSDLFILPFSIIVVILFGGWLFGWMFPTYFLMTTAILYFLLKSLRIKQPKLDWLLILVFAILTYGFATYTYRHLPIKDYRPYATGKDINEQMKSAEELGLQPTVYATIYTLENEETGERQTINSKEYLESGIWKDKSWKIVHSSDEPILLQRGYEPPITTFSVSDEEGDDIGDLLLNDPGFSFMVVMYDLSKTNTGRPLNELRQLADEATARGMDFYAITSSSREAAENFKQENRLNFPIYSADEIFLKTIVRANPGLLLLKEGRIYGKWHANDLPDISQVEKLYMNK